MGESVIKDGRGSGNRAGVRNTGHLKVHSISLLESQWTSQVDEAVFNGNTGKAATLSAVNGCVLYMKNIHPTKLLIIEAFNMSFETAGAAVFCQRNDTGTPGGTTVVPQTNANFKSGLNAEADLFKPSGAAITGLTDGQICAAFRDLPAGPHAFNVSGTLVLGINNVFSVYVHESAALGALAGRTVWSIAYRFVDPIT